MCCRITGNHFVAILLLAALVSLVIAARRTPRFRFILIAGWALVPVWLTAGLAAFLLRGGHAEDARFTVYLYIRIFELPWLLASTVGIAVGLALRRFTRHHRR